MIPNRRSTAYNRRSTDHYSTPGPSHNIRRNRSHSGTPSSIYGVRVRSGPDALTSTPSVLERSHLRSRPERLSFNLKVQSDSDNDSESDISSNTGDNLLLDGIVGSSWKIHQASPLCNFQPHRTRLKQYGKQMREYLSCLSIHSKRNIQFKATFEWFGPTSDESNFQGLKILVVSTCDGQPSKMSYSGFLISAEPTVDQPRDGIVCLPLLLCFGANKLVLQSVHENLKKLFDCTICRMDVPQSELRWLSAMLNGQNLAIKAAQRKHMVEFKFAALSGGGSFVVHLPVDMVRKMWTRIHDTTVSQVLHTEVKAFHESIVQHLMNTLCIDLNSCQFDTFSLPGIILAANGSLKLLSRDIALQTLTFLHSLPATLESAVPCLTHQDN